MAQEYILAAQEYSLVAQEYILVAQESTLVAQEYILVAHEHILVHQRRPCVFQVSLKTHNCFLRTNASAWMRLGPPTQARLASVDRTQRCGHT